MPPLPPSPQPPADPDRRGPLLENDGDARLVVMANIPPAADEKPPPITSPYRPTQRPPLALLTVLDDGKNDGEIVRLRSDRYVIGRSEGDLLIPHDQQISARHVEVTRQHVGEKYRWVVTDLQSSNGLFLRVSRTALSDKTEFLAGMGRYRFETPTSILAETVDALPPDAPHGSTQPLGIEAASLLQPALIELVGGKVLSRLPLVKEEYWIGSDTICEICRASDPFIEPLHIHLYRKVSDAWGNLKSKNVWHAQNNKTANGLWLKVAQITVTDSCSFQIGEQRFRLTAGG